MPIHYHASRPKRVARWNNRNARIQAAMAEGYKARREEYEASGKPFPSLFRKSRVRTFEAPVPTSSLTALTKEYLRRLPAVSWDGIAYVPVPGPAMEAMFAWRRARVEEMNSRAVSERTECPRCGMSFPVPKKNLRSSHHPNQCRVMLVTRIMET